MISLVIPFLDSFDKLERCLEVAIHNAKSRNYEIVLIDNGSRKAFDYSRFNGVPIRYVRNEKNTGVLPTYKQGFIEATGDIICFIHSDVLLHTPKWVQKVSGAFRRDEQLGLLGLFGAKGIGVDGGRSWSIGNMLGKEWGACDCHPGLAAWHHGEPINGIVPAVVLDGLGMFFRDTVLAELVENTDAFDEWRSPHHFYDKILSLKVIDLGYRVAVIDLYYDHFSGATANHSKTYDQTMRDWAKRNDKYIEGEDGDRMVYLTAENQLFEEFQDRLPINVSGDYVYEWQMP